MPSVVETVDLNATRVPIVIPLGAASAFGVAQLFLGGDPFIILMSVAAITVTFVPLHLYGRDIYSMFAILFSFKYVLAALVAKTLYGEPLQSNLFHPYVTYAMVLALMSVETAILMVARTFDPGTTLFPFPGDDKSLRRLAVVSFAFGFGGMLYLGFSADTSKVYSAGPVYVLAASMGGLCFLGIIAEAVRNVQKSDRTALFSPLLIAMLLMVLLTVLALNMRTYFATAIMGIALVGFIYRVIKLKYIVVAGLTAVLFLTFLSPLQLYLRTQRTMGFTQFASLAVETGARMVIDSSFRKYVRDAAKFDTLKDAEQDPFYDYYGDRSNVMNRISFVALLDAVYNASISHKPLGLPALTQSLSVNVPSFFGAKLPYSPSDWLAWQMGMEDPDFTAFLNFGLPMEGLVTWRWIGFIAYPIAFMLPVMLVFSRISSFRIPSPVSIYLFGDLQNGVLEGSSDGFISDIIRGAPLVCLTLFFLYWVFFRRSSPAGALSGSGLKGSAQSGVG